MTYHILNGDMLSGQLKQTTIEGEQIICRECLVVGEVTGHTLAQFWESRARYISSMYNTTAEEYYNKCVRELTQINKLPEGSDICLWFEDDLFCQVNMWFVVSLLRSRPAKDRIFRVFPITHKQADHWQGFGGSDASMLEQAYRSKVLCTTEDMELADALWTAYRTADFEKLRTLSRNSSPCFRHLEAVCQAHIDRFPTDQSLPRPDNEVKDIIAHVSADFKVVFSEFSARLGVYGFGDAQVKDIYDRQIGGTK